MNAPDGKQLSIPEKYGFRKDEELNIDQALNIARKEAEKPESELRKEAEKIEYQPSVMTFNDREQYLNYCLSLCKGKPNYVAFLRIKIGMCSNPAFEDLSDLMKNIEISKALKKFGIHVSHNDVEKLEKDAIRYVQDQISNCKDVNLPILGNPQVV